MLIDIKIKELANRRNRLVSMHDENDQPTINTIEEELFDLVDESLDSLEYHIHIHGNLGQLYEERGYVTDWIVEDILENPNNSICNYIKDDISNHLEDYMDNITIEIQEV